MGAGRSPALLPAPVALPAPVPPLAWPGIGGTSQAQAARRALAVQTGASCVGKGRPWHLLLPVPSLTKAGARRAACPRAPQRARGGQAACIKLADEDGNPLPGRRFVVVAGDGSERSGTLDENGEAELLLEEGGEIIFPDADNPRQA